MQQRKKPVPRQRQIVPTRPAYYTWSWVKATDKTVLIQGHSRYLNKRNCQLAAKAVTSAVSGPAILRIGCFAPDETRLRVLEYNHQPKNPAMQQQEVEDGDDFADEDDVRSQGTVELPSKTARGDACADASTIAAEKPTFTWEWRCKETEMKTATGERYATEQLSIREAVKAKPSYEAALTIATVAADGRIRKREVIPEEDGRLLNVTVFSGCLVPERRRAEAVKNPEGTSRVEATYFKGEPRIDIRRWIHGKDGKAIPTKKGLSLPLQRWVQLLSVAEQVTGLVDRIKQQKERIDEKIHVSGPVFASVCSPWWNVHLREFYQDRQSGDIRPSRRGLILKHEEWASLLTYAEQIAASMPQVSSTAPCIFQTDHCNQEGAMACAECNPFGFSDYISD